MTYDLDQMVVVDLVEAERLVKSDERVRHLGEVFTPAATVAAMLDLLPADVWAPHPSATFLEPACGDGNFLVAILSRKLSAVAEAASKGDLSAGEDEKALAFHALEALSSIYAVDISVDNVEGGTLGHEVGARDRLVRLLIEWWVAGGGQELNENSPILSSARWIVDRNILVGNMLAENADGTPSGREQLPLVAYDWDPSSGRVTVSCTTLGTVMSEAIGVMTLLDLVDVPESSWTVAPTDIHKAAIPAPVPSVLIARNGNGTR
jgi:hypothetical protein